MSRPWTIPYFYKHLNTLNLRKNKYVVVGYLYTDQKVSLTFRMPNRYLFLHIILCSFCIHQINFIISINKVLLFHFILFLFFHPSSFSSFSSFFFFFINISLLFFSFLWDIFFFWLFFHLIFKYFIICLICVFLLFFLSYICCKNPIAIFVFSCMS